MTPEQQRERAKALSHQAGDARENTQFTEALDTYDIVLSIYRDLGLHKEVSETYAAIALTCRLVLRTLVEREDRLIWQERMLENAKLGLEEADVARRNEDFTAYAMAYFQVGEALKEVGEIGKAEECLAQAIFWIQQAPPPEHDRPAVKLNMQLHLALTQLEHSQSLDARPVVELINLLRAQAVLPGESQDPDKGYNIPVWASGAYLRLAKYFKDKDNRQARIFLTHAKNIIEPRPDLVIRRAEFEELAKEFEK